MNQVHLDIDMYNILILQWKKYDFKTSIKFNWFWIMSWLSPSTKISYSTLIILYLISMEKYNSQNIFYLNFKYNLPNVRSSILLYITALDFRCTIRWVIAWYFFLNSLSLCVDSKESDLCNAVSCSSPKSKRKFWPMTQLSFVLLTIH